MNTSSLQESRIEWVDTAKLIGIYLVILGHLPLKNIFATNFIFTFHMPLFFFLSGFVEKHRSVKETAIRSTKNLLVPYICEPVSKVFKRAF